jgi:hypothetical protein
MRSAGLVRRMVASAEMKNTTATNEIRKVDSGTAVLMGYQRPE